MRAAEAADCTMCARRAAVNGKPEGMALIYGAIRAAAAEGYFHTYIRLTPAQKIAIEAAGYETVEAIGNYKIVWGKG